MPETPDGCGCQYDAAGRMFRTRCICPPPLTPEQTLRGVAGIGGGIGDAVRDLLAERDELRAQLNARDVQAKSATIQAVGLRAERDEARAVAANAETELARVTEQRDAWIHDAHITDGHAQLLASRIVAAHAWLVGRDGLSPAEVDQLRALLGTTTEATDA